MGHIILSWIVLGVVLGQTGRAGTMEPTTSPIAKPPATSASDSTAKSGLTNQDLQDHLSLILADNTPPTRRMGAQKLLEAGTAEAIKAVGQVLSGQPPASMNGHPGGELPAGGVSPTAPDLAARIAVCEAIAAQNRADALLIEPLMTLLGDSRPGLSEAVGAALQRFDPVLVVRHLAPIASEDSADLDRRLAAITSLGALGDRSEAAAALFEILREASPTVRSAALNSSRQITGVDHRDEAAALAWWADHRQMSSDGWLRLRADVKARELNRLQGEAAALTARLVGAYRDAYFNLPEAQRSQRLDLYLQDGTPAVRQLGLDLINSLITDRMDISPEVKRRLIELLSDPSPPVRLQATKMVGDLRPVAALADLLRELAVETEAAIRVAQIRSLGRLEDPKAITVLIERLNDDVPAARAEAATALAACAGRSGASREEAGKAAKALEDRFARLGPGEDVFREQLLSALALLADPAVRHIFEQELKSDRPVRVRRMALLGLATYGDLSAADALLPLLVAPEVEIRFAAADGVGKCGRRRGDLDALTPLLAATSEPDASVRGRAWDSFLQIVQRLAPAERISISDKFDTANDKLMQRRRLDLIKTLLADSSGNGTGRSSGPAPVDPVTPATRIDLLVRLGDCQWKLGEYSAAAASFDQAIAATGTGESKRLAELSLRYVAARLKGHEDAEAIERIKALCAELGTESPAAGSAVQALVDEAADRLQSAVDETSFTEVSNFIEKGVSALGACRPTFGRRLAGLLQDLTTRREAAIEKLLATGASDAESKLLTFDRDLVLPRLCARLSANGTTSGPAPNLEDAWVRLAKRLVPDWPGIVLGADEAERKAAIRSLLELSRKPEGARRPTSSQQSSRGQRQPSARAAG